MFVHIVYRFPMLRKIARGSWLCQERHYIHLYFMDDAHARATLYLIDLILNLFFYIWSYLDAVIYNLILDTCEIQILDIFYVNYIWYMCMWYNVLFLLDSWTTFGMWSNVVIYNVLFLKLKFWMVELHLACEVMLCYNLFCF